jgi:hypothetical protein
MGHSAKAPEVSDEQREMEKLQKELLEEQLRQAKNPLALPEFKVPPPPPPPPPPPTESSADAVEAEREARALAARRLNNTRGTLFAGDTGGYRSSTLGAKTLLG